MSTSLKIENTTWYVRDLQRNLENIIKPKFQRKSRWLITPSKKNKPSYSEYIKFLYKTQNSVDPISFGTMIENCDIKYINIDGNNRINAIIKFITNPLKVFKLEFESNIRKLLEYKIPLNIIESINYDTIKEYRRIDEISQIQIYLKNLNKKEEKEVDDIFQALQKKLSINNGNFLDKVKININIFSNGNYEDYNNIFSSINRHSNELSDNELLASILYSSNIHISTKEDEILEEIRSYYNERDMGEILNNTLIIDSKKGINIFDYMVGLQNSIHKKCKYINIYQSKGLGLIFKIFKIIYNIDKIDKKSFINFEPDIFTRDMYYVANTLNDIFNKICNERVHKKVFNNSAKIENSVKENSKLILMISILALKKKNLKHTGIVKILSKVLFYHILVKYLSKNKNFNPDELAILINQDKLQYQAGGCFIYNICIKIYKNDAHLITHDINEKLITESLSKVINSLNKPSLAKTQESRQKLTIIHKIVFNIILAKLPPAEWLDSEYSIEHIIPFSSKYSEELDLNRLGNLLPLPILFNKKRGNRHIHHYNIICKDYYKGFIQRIHNNIDKKYNNIIEYQTIEENSNKPCIKNFEQYDKMCTKIENFYMKKCIEYLLN